MGEPLQDSAAWSASIGADVSSTRVVTGPEAAQATLAVGAKAFTLKDRIVVGNPDASQSQIPRWLLRHELLHAAQQRHATLPTDTAPRITSRDEPMERAAWLDQPSPQATSEAVIARAPENPDLVDSRTFYETHKAQIWSELLGPLSKAHLDPGSPHASWLWGRNDSFLYNVFVPISFANFDVLVRTTWPDNVDAAIRRGRDADENGLAPNVYRPEIGQELRAIYLPLVQSSLYRITPQYVAASYIALREARARGESPGSEPPRPEASQMVPSHPLDVYVINGLRGQTGSQLLIDTRGYEQEGLGVMAEQQLKRLRPATVTWEATRGAWLWARLTTPDHPSPEEAAQALYGDPSLASSLISVPPLFGFEPHRLTPSRHAEWRATVLAPSTPRSALSYTGPTGSDPYREIIARSGVPPVMNPLAELMRSQSMEEAALGQAAGLPATGATRPQIIARLRLNQHLLESISDGARLMSRAWFAGNPARARITERANTLAKSADDTLATHWDAHSQAQQELLGDVANGMRAVTEQYRQMVPASERPGVLPEYLRAPLIQVADAFIAAGAACEFIALARERLARANELLQRYPLDMMDGLLAYVRSLLRESAGAPAVASGLQLEMLRTKEHHLRGRLLEARKVLLSDPARLSAILNELQLEISDLQDQASMASTLQALDAEWDFLSHNQTAVGVFTGKNERYQQAADVLREWRLRFHQAYVFYQSDRASVRAEGRAQLRELRSQADRLQSALSTVISMIDSQERRERWINLGLRIGALIGIAIITAGIGSYVSSSLLVGAGWGATTTGLVGATIVSSGAEAAAFTAFSTMVFGRDPHQGVVSALLENWALFGALKGLAIGYEAVAGVNAATSVLGRTGNVVTGLSAQIGYTLTRANAEARRNGGAGLSEQQMTEMVTENLVVFIGTVLVSRYGAKGFLEGSRIRGEQSFLARFATVDAARAEAFRAASALSRNSSLEQARRAIRADDNALRQEVELLRDIERFAEQHPTLAGQMQLDAAKLRNLRSINEGQLVLMERASLGLELEPVGGDFYQCAPGHLAEILRRYEKLGSRVTRLPADPDTGQHSASVYIRPGESLHIMERLPGGEGSVLGSGIYRTTPKPSLEARHLAAKAKNFGTSGQAPLPHGAQLTGVPTVNTTRAGVSFATADLNVPVVGGTVQVRLTMLTRPQLRPSQAHGAAAGPGRLSITPPQGKEGWRAVIVLNAHLAEQDVRPVLGHEMIEIIETIRDVELRAASNPSLDLRTAVGGAAEARVLRRGSTATSTREATPHDRAAAWELIQMFAEIRPFEQYIRQTQKENKPIQAAKANEFAVKRARIEAMLEAFGMRESTGREAKLKLLAEAGMSPGDLLQLEVRATLYEHQLRVPEIAAPDRIVTERLLDHLFDASVQKAKFQTSGIAGAHITSKLLEFVKNHPDLYVVEEGSLIGPGGAVFRKFSQYIWKGHDTPRDFPVKGSQPRSSAPSSSKTYDDTLWARAEPVKTTCDDIGVYVQAAERAWQTFQSTHFPTPPSSKLSNQAFGPSARKDPSAPSGPAAVHNGIQFSGYFNYHPPPAGGPPRGRFELISIFPEGTWIP
ncbi:MAG TPA: DUF4157 domain-containing protein [Archangium sp.]|nr:DUF4157 domain-containing protein [Archangium sp.]